MKNIQLIFVLLLSIFALTGLSAQTEGLSMKTIKKLHKCQLKINDKRIPAAYLHQVTADTITLYYDVQNNLELRSVLAKQKFAISAIQSAKVSKKKRSFLFISVGAAALGATTYFLLKKDNSTTNLMGETSSNGLAGNGTAVLGGVVGGVVGASIGLTLSKQRVNFRTDQQAAVAELKRLME